MTKVLIALLFILIFLIQIFNIFVLDATYDWAFIAIIFVAIFVFSFLYVKIGYGIIKNDFKNKKYDRVISKQNCYLAKKTALKDSIFYMVAVSYLELNDIDSFGEFIDKIDSNNLYLSKSFLKIIYAIIICNNDLESEWKDKYDNNPPSVFKSHLDDILILLQEAPFKKGNWNADELKIIESIEIDFIKNMIIN